MDAMRQRARWFFLFVAICRIAGAAEPGCQLHEPALRVPRANIFNEQQEQWLGDAQAAMVEPRYTLVPEADTAYLNAIAQKLLAQLPPTSIHYTIGVFESADLRAFSLAGGRIYISLKLIMDARNEDELAAMIAQEVGRVYTHHSASSVTLRLNKLMHVKTLGDQADVADKFARLLNVPETDASQLNADDEKRDDLLADQVGLYALIRAKYAPEAFATFLDRVNNNGGYTGSWFTDLADATPEVSIRVRTAHTTVDALSTSCRRSRPLYAPIPERNEKPAIRSGAPRHGGTDLNRARSADESGFGKCGFERGRKIRDCAGRIEDPRADDVAAEARVLSGCAGGRDGAVHSGLPGPGVQLQRSAH
jgi:hypothetical protein